MFKVLKLNLTNSDRSGGPIVHLSKSRLSSHFPEHNPTCLLPLTACLSGTRHFPVKPPFLGLRCRTESKQDAHQEKSSFGQSQGMQLVRRS